MTKHFIITRFNLRLYSRDKRRQPTRTDEWLGRRFDIFETFCLPSIAAQSDKNFTWLVLFDDSTPENYRRRIEDLRKVCPELTPLFYSAAQVEDLTGHLGKEILKLSAGASRVLTTNLDNDDALSVNWVAESAALAGRERGSEPVIFSFTRGMQYFTGMRMAIRMRLSNNHFLSLSEPATERLQTIVAYRHARVTGHFATRYIDSPRDMWLEVVHSSNVSNDLRIYNKVRYIPVFAGDALRGFGSRTILSPLRQWLMTFMALPLKFAVTGVRRLAGKSARMKHSRSVKCETTDSL
jgi:hypothetical protein